MALFYLVNRTPVGTRKLLPGALIDSDQEDTTAITAAGGLLIASSDATIATAAALAQQMALRGQHHAAELVMLAAASKSTSGDDNFAATKAKADAAPAFQAVAAGAMVSGTLTISSGLVLTAASEVIPILRGAVTGSTNFGSLRELVSSRVTGADGVATVVIQAVGIDGAIDADAAVAAGLIHAVVLTAQ